MKKLLSVILVLGLLLGGNAYAKIVTLEKCYLNDTKKEYRELSKGKVSNPQTDEFGFKDESWSEKSYKKFSKLSDAYESKVTINTERLIVSFITMSSPEISKRNINIVDYTDNIIFAEEQWDTGALGSFFTHIGDAKWQINIKEKTMFMRENNLNEMGNGNSQMTMHTRSFLCEPSDQSDADGDGTGSGGSGTAFFVSNKGYLLTNNHVVKGCSLSKITYFNKEYDAKLIATDKTLDLALLKVKVKPKSYFSFSKDEPKKLQKIYVAGYPLGKGLSDDLKITTGIISALKGFEDNSNEIQVDAAINPGNSGGPIVNENGELVAIAVSGITKAQNINFGIKSSAAANFLKLNSVKPSKSLMSFSSDTDELLEILEEATVYTFCN